MNVLAAVSTAALAGAVISTAIALGSAIWRCLTDDWELAKGPYLAGSASLGLGVLSLTGTAMASLDVLEASVTGIGTAVLLPFVWRDLSCWVRTFCTMSRQWLDTHSPWERLPVAVIAVALLLYTFEAVSPPTAADTLAYHYAYPKLVASEAGLVYVPDVATNGPLYSHMLYALGMALADVRLAGVISWIQLAVACLAIVALAGALLGSRHAGLWVGSIFITLPMVADIGVAGHVDIPLMLYSLMGVWMMLEWARADRYLTAVLAGLFLGFAAGIKYYGLFTLAIVPVLTMLSIVVWRRIPVRRIVLATGLILMVAVCVACPWWLRNYANTGNPLYPAFYSLFGGTDWSASLDAAFSAFTERHKRALPVTPWMLLTLPWIVTMNGSVLGAARNGYGLVPFLMIPTVGLAMWHNQRFREIGIFVIVYAGLFASLWLALAFHRSRHLLPVVPWLLILGVGGVQGAWKWERLRPFIVWPLAVGVVFQLSVTVVHGAQFIPVALGIESSEDFTRRKTWYHDDVVWLNHTLQPGERLLHFNRLLNYPLNVDYFFASVYFQGFLDWSRTRNVRGLSAELTALGITHLYIDERRYPPSRLEAIPDPVIRNAMTVIRDLTTECGEEVYRSRRTTAESRTLGIGTRQLESVVYRLHLGNCQEGER